ncbi:MAG TPA: ABC transporter substrate-binding protein, partial [Dissulfurispiraceae bacterium]|nr:ABC transporter substrate-binding protein [Dissulfurispiraceae bacterium]
MVLIVCGCGAQQPDGYLHLRLASNPSTLDPALITDVASSTLAAKLFNGLVRLNGDLEVIPDISERWSLSDDGCLYRFVLRPDVRFPDGRPVRADDILYSFQRVVHPHTRSPNAWIFENVLGAVEYRQGKAEAVKGFRVIDERTFEITLRQPFSPFLRMLTMSPAFIVQRETVERLGAQFAHEPSGTGPFSLSRWDPDRELVLVKKNTYFGGEANVRGISYRIIPEDLTMLTEFESGNLDIIPLPAAAFSKFMADMRWKDNILTLQGMNTYYLGMNCARPPMADARLRRAVSLAIDRRKILETFYENRGRLAFGPVADLLRRWQSASSVAPFDQATARSLVRSAGADGMVLQLYVTADQEVIDLAEIVQAYLKQVGLNVHIKQLEWSAYKAAINQGEADI